MHEYTTHNRDYKTFEQFRAAILTFLNQTIPKKWEHFRDRINDNFRVIHHCKLSKNTTAPLRRTGYHITAQSRMCRSLSWRVKKQ